MTNTTCSFCGAANERLVHGPGMQICVPCVKKFLDHPVKDDAPACSFCGQTFAEVEAMHAAGNKAVCGYCLTNMADTL